MTPAYIAAAIARLEALLARGCFLPDARHLALTMLQILRRRQEEANLAVGRPWLLGFAIGEAKPSRHHFTFQTPLPAPDDVGLGWKP